MANSKTVQLHPYPYVTTRNDSFVRLTPPINFFRVITRSYYSHSSPNASINQLATVEIHTLRCFPLNSLLPLSQRVKHLTSPRFEMLVVKQRNYNSIVPSFIHLTYLTPFETSELYAQVAIYISPRIPASLRNISILKSSCRTLLRHFVQH